MISYGTFLHSAASTILPRPKEKYYYLKMFQARIQRAGSLERHHGFTAALSRKQRSISCVEIFCCVWSLLQGLALASRNTVYAFKDLMTPV
jgi:hypothetical protein